MIVLPASLTVPVAVPSETVKTRTPAAFAARAAATGARVPSVLLPSEMTTIARPLRDLCAARSDTTARSIAGPSAVPPLSVSLSSEASMVARSAVGASTHVHVARRTR